ncbi:hypothetical protein ACVNS2_16675 [Paenibacillus caseinilyticus]|uniref:DUF2187 domain-containing protein n=1 Tax=Paenibacillus mucilaginosus K02 TaxID=997761 RepID=I0BIT0_9BACL|nr:hypothetical protein [Paenibacillus mucilaginosus]AFH62277.1 hypothetical protein B2K_16375 [Paenibacillus mucilaginosus K02]
MDKNVKVGDMVEVVYELASPRGTKEEVAKGVIEQITDQSVTISNDESYTFMTWEKVKFIRAV